MTILCRGTSGWGSILARGVSYKRAQATEGLRRDQEARAGRQGSGDPEGHEDWSTSPIRRPRGFPEDHPRREVLAGFSTGDERHVHGKWSGRLDRLCWSRVNKDAVAGDSGTVRHVAYTYALGRIIPTIKGACAPCGQHAGEGGSGTHGRSVAFDKCEAPGRIRTSNLRVSYPALFPVELRGLAKEIPGLGAALPGKACGRPRSGFSATCASGLAQDSITYRWDLSVFPRAVGATPGWSGAATTGTSNGLVAGSSAVLIPGSRERALLRSAGDQLPEHRFVVVPAVPLPNPLVEVALEPAPRDRVMGTTDIGFEVAKEAINRLGVNLALDVYPRPVIDSPVEIAANARALDSRGTRL